MKSLQLLFFIFLTICCTHFAQAQWIGDSVNDAHILKGIHYVYNLTFDSAKTEFQQVIKSRPDHPAGYFFLAMTDWWKIVIDINNTS
ncbi:MAG TPA: hypothetical protein VKI62_09990, partial [Bacteroidota bacterium]|nr:hypothetical protein [Bacteroidota bacterium]